MARQLRWGILGTAGIAMGSLIPAIKESERGTVAAIASRSADKARRAAEQAGIPRSCGSYEELLADPEIDAVYIPLPNHLHKEWTIKAAQAGKHVLCEKPAALNAQETREMLEACERHGVLFSEAFMYRYGGKHQRLREILDSGEIGEIRAMHGVFTYCTPDDTGNVRFDRAKGGGSIYDIGVYPFSAARMIAQAEPLWASAHAFFSPEHDQVDMNASGLLGFPGGIALTFQCGMWAYNRSYFEVTGTLGRIELPYMFGWRENPQLVVHTDRERREEKLPCANHYALQADAFARAVFGEEPLPYGPRDALRNMRVVDACLQSAREGRRADIEQD
ncbi:Gfo/Idh/MocA family oxidoreductase [Saccharibacillus sp. CPCC 101409]|uniref:Gfo/Idh/MocA family protein n=1 Tax=Saccharibacillus sp. CPCC 101409 TaxID=3058041 RepID=UPI0026738FC2|nr:Gfo/Idh/MocA family oxidoreductase [Saccharibacillus sp. CPCC 101409]MDO3411696.1 Gfo/Idh/MocA family oxidoreductase [Saccharibacillus sp. CPCC 101409]